MKILLIGSNGQVGWELQRTLPDLGELVALDRDRLNLTRLNTIPPVIGHVHPDCIVNAAGYTAVDRAEQEPAIAQRINAEAPEVIAEAAAEFGIPLIHYSTDYVFDGESDRPYHPSDPTNPLNVYGRTKLAGEEAITASGADSLIIRTSWVYSKRRTNFLLTMLRQAAIKSELKVVDDQFGAPTPARIIAECTAHVIRESVGASEQRPSFGPRGGIHHLMCSGITTWYGFAKAILDLAEITPRPVLTPIATDAYPTAALRPRFSALDCSEFQEQFNVTLPPWQEGLRRVMSEEERSVSSCAPQPTTEEES